MRETAAVLAAAAIALAACTSGDSDAGPSFSDIVASSGFRQDVADLVGSDDVDVRQSSRTIGERIGVAVADMDELDAAQFERRYGKQQAAYAADLGSFLAYLEHALENGGSDESDRDVSFLQDLLAGYASAQPTFAPAADATVDRFIDHVRGVIPVANEADYLASLQTAYTATARQLDGG